MNFLGNSLCFDDILLVPRHSSIKSRQDIKLSMNIGSINLDLPIIASPMDTVCDVDMCYAMARHGGMGILHRYMSNYDQLKKVKQLVDSGIGFGVAIGINNESHVNDLYDCGVRCMLVDTANGHNSYVIETVKRLRQSFSDIHIMAGNVSTQEGFAHLANAGANSIRVGIGGGSACTTRIVTGHGVPTLSSIMKCKTWKDSNSDCAIIADGGIRSSGDIVKAFAAGADAVMLGSMLAGTFESPGKIIDHNGRRVKEFRGMASFEAQKENNKLSVVEGISSFIEYKGSVDNILNSIKGGISSGCSYSGVDRLSLLHKFSSYITVSSASLSESIPHIGKRS